MAVAVVERGEVLAAGVRSLAELERFVEEEHTAVGRLLGEAVERSIRIGEALWEARAQVRRGGWTAWLRDRGMPYHAAQFYARCARHAEALRAAGVVSGREAKRFLAAAGLEVQREVGNRKPDETRAEAIRLVRDEGLSLRATARLCGVSAHAVRSWLNPEAKREQSRRDSAKRTAKRRAAREATRKTATERALVKEGEAFNEFWRMVQKMDPVLGQAREETEDREKRRAISELHALRNQMHDKAVKMLGVS